MSQKPVLTIEDYKNAYNLYIGLALVAAIVFAFIASNVFTLIPATILLYVSYTVKKAIDKMEKEIVVRK